jgi:prepilin-type N-terminal cleavage/methylation domain-containing protein
MKLSLLQLGLFRRNSRSDDRGFTLTEVLVVIIIAGVLAGIAAPSWLTFVDRQRMTTIRSELLLKVKEAQAKSLRTKTLQRVVIDNPGGGVRPTVSVLQGAKVTNTTTGATTIVDVGTDPGKKTLGGDNSSAFILQVIPSTATLTFNYGGTIESPKIALGSQVTSADNTTALLMYRVKPRASSTSMSACLIVDTLIGAIREVTDDQCK